MFNPVLHPVPDILNRIQIWAVWWPPQHLDPHLSKKLLREASSVCWGVILLKENLFRLRADEG
jgi:hypothetical protein